MNIDWTREIQEGHSNKQCLFTNKNSLLNDAETYIQKNNKGKKLERKSKNHKVKTQCLAEIRKNKFTNKN